MTNASTTPPLLSVRNLAVWFDGPSAPTKAVDGVSFTVYPRQTVAIVGESGCGKSVTALSLLRLLPSPPARYVRGSAHLVEPGSPSLDLMKASERELRAIRGGRIAMIFQEPMTSLNPVVTISEQVAEAVRLHRGLSRREAYEAAIGSLDRVGISDAAGRAAAYPHEFSGGMRQRVMIAMALACRPALLLADEPTTALDVTVQAQILDLLAEMRRDLGMGVVFITHDLGIVASRADVVCVMYGGRVVEYTDVFTIFRRPLHPYTRGLIASVPRTSTGRLRTVHDLIGDRREFEVATAAGPMTAWWPQHEGANVGSLVEVSPGHWVRAENPPTDGALTPPALAFVRDHEVEIVARTGSQA